MELLIVGKDKRELAVELRTSPGIAAAPDRRHYLSVVIDLTDRRRVEGERDQLLQRPPAAKHLLHCILRDGSPWPCASSAPAANR